VIREEIWVCKSDQALAWPEILIGGEGPKMEKNLWRNFGDIITMTSLKLRYNWFLSLIYSWSVWKNTIWPCHATSVHQNRRLRGLAIFTNL